MRTQNAYFVLRITSRPSRRLYQLTMILEDAMTTLTLDTIAFRPHRLRWVYLKQTFVEWRRRSRSRAELMSLGDRSLHDLGVSRATAQFEACKPFWVA